MTTEQTDIFWKAILKNLKWVALCRGEDEISYDGYKRQIFAGEDIKFGPIGTDLAVTHVGFCETEEGPIMAAQILPSPTREGDTVTVIAQKPQNVLK